MTCYSLLRPYFLELILLCNSFKGFFLVIIVLKKNEKDLEGDYNDFNVVEQTAEQWDKSVCVCGVPWGCIVMVWL